jgi:hypothetical protein
VHLVGRCLITFHHVLPMYSCCWCVVSNVTRPETTPELFHTQPCQSDQQLIILTLPWAWAHDTRISVEITELLHAVSLNIKLAQFLYRSLKCLGFWHFIIIHNNTILLTFHDWCQWIRTIPCGKLPSPIAQIALSSDNKLTFTKWDWLLSCLTESDSPSIIQHISCFKYVFVVY